MISLSGLLNLNKPSGMTSREVVDIIARPLKGSRLKVGHAGTLDPLATGVLVVAVGTATRLIDFIQAQSKSYRALVRLGVTSESDDVDGTVLEVEGPPIPTHEHVLEALATQVGTILQRPPRISALKVNGKRAYALARSGVAVSLSPRKVHVERLELRAYEWPYLSIEVTCGSGTYIRAIARDVGEVLGCGGIVNTLERICIGDFKIDKALDVLPGEWTVHSIASRLLPVSSAVSHLPSSILDSEQVGMVQEGRSLAASRLGGRPLPGGWCALIDSSGSLVAVAEHDVENGEVRPRRVLIGRA
jgi:tRNA pseudouridine55 synthase